MRLLHLPAHEYRRERWRNERGWTREIHRHPEGAAEWAWRVSIAEIDHDAPFSAFPGVDRELVLLHGNGGMRSSQLAAQRFAIVTAAGADPFERAAPPP